MKSRGEVSEWVEITGLPHLKLDRYKPAGKKAYLRIIAKCRTHGDGCIKKRNATHCATLGKIEPVAYLAAWDERGATCTREQHTQRNFIVPMELVRK